MELIGPILNMHAHQTRSMHEAAEMVRIAIQAFVVKKMPPDMQTESILWFGG